MKKLFAFLRRAPGLALAIAGLVTASALAIGAPWVFGHDAFALVAEPFIRPGTDARFPLGTDMLGRDILAGIVWGARVSLLVGLVAAALSVAIGVTVGLAAGYCGRTVDHLLMRVTELFQTIPTLVFVVTLVAILQPSVGSIVAAIAVTSWPQTARLVRAETLRLRASEFVQAAHTMGLGQAAIIGRHVLPNAISPAVVTGTLLAGSAILTEAALAFLGLGDPNLMSWGAMVGAGRQVLRSASYITLLPGLAIVLTVLAVTTIGDALNRRLQPRLDP